MKTLVLPMALLLILGGCATTKPSMYQWGGYDGKLYATYKESNKVEELRVALETLIAQQEQANRKVAPGLYAELGTLYLQAGSSDLALDMYKKERAAWPESKGLMDALISNIERRSQAKQEAAK